MSIKQLGATELAVTIAPAALGFVDTTELLAQPLTWVGQERARAAAGFGLAMTQPDYHLFVLGEVGSGRSSLLRQLMQAAAQVRPVPPDLCYLHNFETLEQPVALKLPPGRGRSLRQAMLTLAEHLQRDIPARLAGPDVRLESDRIQKAYVADEARAYRALDAFAQARQFSLYRQDGELVFTLLGEQGEALTEAQARALPSEQRDRIDLAEQELRAEIGHFLAQIRPLERDRDERLGALRRQTIRPLLAEALQAIRAGLPSGLSDASKLDAWLDQIMANVLDHLPVFSPAPEEDEDNAERVAKLVARYRVNLLVDNATLVCAPVLVENNPSLRRLMGGVDFLQQEDTLLTDFSRIRAGSLHRAHGGYLMLHLEDVLAEEGVWDKLRRFVRTGRLHLDEPGPLITPMAAVSLRPEALDLDVKLVLIGSTDDYELLLEADPEFTRRFRAKVVLVPAFRATAATYQASAVFVAHTCARLGLPPLTAAAVARLLEQSHREVDDQTRQSANFARAEALILESGALCRAKGGARVEASDIEAALLARQQRHDDGEQRLREAVADGDWLIRWQGEALGQLNGLGLVDLGDYRFGVPVRVSAQTYAGADGVLNIEREAALSGPIHDKGVLVLASYLTALFAAQAPLALNAAIVLEQEYQGVEGDSASCAELLALLSALSGLPLKQGIAVTGALNQHGELLPVGGINEKIEGYFRICDAAGLDGTQGVLIPERNRRHLMLDRRVCSAVAEGRFHIYTASHALDGMALLSGWPTGLPSRPGGYAPDTVLGRAARSLQAYRRACQRAAPDRLLQRSARPTARPAR
jgi:predicted ATP-dependent protease